MQTAYFFGYGSLVNRHTHIYAPAHHATVQGWRRAWRVAADRQVAFLTVIRDEDCAIDGLIAPVPDPQKAFQLLPANCDALRGDDARFAEGLLRQPVIAESPEFPEFLPVP